MAVAADSQGAAAVSPFAETAKDISILIDTDNLLGEAFGFKAIPNGILVGDDGTIDAVAAGKFDIRRPETRETVTGWLSDVNLPASRPAKVASPSAEALRLYRQAADAIRRANRAEAIDLLRMAYPLDPDNYIIRKQLWAIEHPERFYCGEIDRSWQDEQLERGL